MSSVRNGVPIGPQAASPWLYVYPQGFRELLLYVKEKYDNPAIYITENGIDEVNNNSLPLQEALKDDTRIEYHNNHVLSLLSAIRSELKQRTLSLKEDGEVCQEKRKTVAFVHFHYNPYAA